MAKYFILAMILMLTSAYLVLADSNNNTSWLGRTVRCGGDLSTDSGDDITAGFKVELMLLIMNG